MQRSSTPCTDAHAPGRPPHRGFIATLSAALRATHACLMPSHEEGRVRRTLPRRNSCVCVHFSVSGRVYEWRNADAGTCS
jgi:hypothetical protein